MLREERVATQLKQSFNLVCFQFLKVLQKGYKSYPTENNFFIALAF